MTKRFSLLAFGVIAAPGLAILVAGYTPYFAPRSPTGFDIELAWNAANTRVTTG